MKRYKNITINTEKSEALTVPEVTADIASDDYAETDSDLYLA